MANTFAQQRAADATGVILSTSDFAETITHYPRGGDIGESVSAIVAIDEERGPAEALDDSAGSALIRRGLLTLSTDVSVTIQEREQYRSEFVIRNQRWIATGFDGVDAYIQHVRIERNEGIASKRTRVQ